MQAAVCMVGFLRKEIALSGGDRVPDKPALQLGEEVLSALLRSPFLLILAVKETEARHS